MGDTIITISTMLNINSIANMDEEITIKHLERIVANRKEIAKLYKQAETREAQIVYAFALKETEHSIKTLLGMDQ
jgi:hypothetical protein